MNRNRARVNSIVESFDGIGLDSTTLYTNQEIVDGLVAVQKKQLEGVYEQTHAEHMRDRDLMLHFSTLASEYGLSETPLFKRFEANMNDMGYTIGSFIKGMKGEHIARRALKLITFDKGVKVLYNVALEDEDAQAEYDAIVITPYGMFVVEVKNWGASMRIDENGVLRRDDQDIKYDLPGRMSVKEGLLRECLGELFPSQYQSIVLFSNENAKVQDDYKQMPISFGGGIVYSIRSFNGGKVLLTESQIEMIAEKLRSSHKEQRALCKVNCKEIIEDYAVLMAAIEAAADGEYAAVEELKNVETVITREEGAMEIQQNIPESSTRNGVERGKKISNAVFGTIGILVVFGLGVVSAKNINRK